MNDTTPDTAAPKCNWLLYAGLTVLAWYACELFGAVMSLVGR